MIYEIFVRSFRDSNGDGIGDLNGISQSVDYLKEIGCSHVWITPIFASPSFHGYDISDFLSVNPCFGTIDDFNNMVQTLHRNGIRVILDIPLNHTSSQHEWFQKALLGDDACKSRYVWANSSTNIEEVRPWDNVPVWHSSPQGYYHGTFGGSMPDLDYSNSFVLEYMLDVMKFWVKRGADGFRFDAAKHIFEYDHQKNIDFWRNVSKCLKAVNPDLMLIGEVWDHPEVVKSYSQAIGYCFSFDLASQIKEAILKGDPQILLEAISRNSLTHSVLFLTNHDMSRLATQMKDERLRKLAFQILFTLPGVPCLYYGEELGMKGEYNPFFTEHVIEPFPWYEALHGKGQTMWKATMYNTGFSGVSVEENRKRENSLFWRIKSLSRFRKLNGWIQNALVENYRCEGPLLIYDVHGARKISVIHNFSDSPISCQERTVGPWSTLVIAADGHIVFSD